MIKYLRSISDKKQQVLFQNMANLPCCLNFSFINLELIIEDIPEDQFFSLYSNHILLIQVRFLFIYFRNFNRIAH